MYTVDLEQRSLWLEVPHKVQTTLSSDGGDLPGPWLCFMNSRVPTRTFSVPGFFLFWLRPRISSPCRLGVRTTGKSQRLIDGASTSYEPPPLLEDFLSRCKSPEGRILSPNLTHKTS